MPPDTFVLDHLVLVAQTLESGARYIEQKLGVKPGNRVCLIQAQSLELSTPDDGLPQNAIVAGHPFGSDNISAVTCETSVQPGALAHACDTWPGSSGSAVVDPRTCKVSG